MGCGHHANGIQPGVEDLDQLGSQLHDPVRPGKAQISGTQVQHLYDVLGLEDLRVDVGQGQGGAVAASGGLHLQACIGHELEHTFLHASLGQGQADGSLVFLHRCLVTRPRFRHQPRLNDQRRLRGRRLGWLDRCAATPSAVPEGMGVMVMAAMGLHRAAH